MSSETRGRGNFKDLDSDIKHLLIKEIDIIQRQITKYDEFSLIIKGWAITLWSALLFLLLERHAQLEYPELILVVIIIFMFIFWFFDALYKKFQRVSNARSRAITDYINGKAANNNFWNNFPIFDPVGDLAKDNYYYKIKYLEKAKFWKSFSVRVNSAPYSVLIAITLFFLTFTLNDRLLNNLGATDILNFLIGISIFFAWFFIFFAIVLFYLCEKNII